jgi:hypothetical protein
MKTPPRSPRAPRRTSPALLPSAALALLAACGTPALAQDVLLNGFDDEFATSGFWQWWGAIFQEVLWDGTADAQGNPASGAIKFNFEFDNTLDDNQYAIGWALSGLGSYDGSVVASAADYTALAFDVRWDAESSTVELDAFNNSGADPGFHMGFATTSWGQTWVQGAPPVSTEWQRVVIPIGDATPNFPGLVFKKWQPGGGNPDALNGVASLWIDNISLVRRTEATPPPTLSIERAAPQGLQLIASAAGQQYQRQNIQAIGAENTFWYGNADPVTYIVEFAGFPAAAPDFQAHIFLCPDSSGGGSPDWADPNVFFFDIHANADNAQCHVRYKVDEPNGNTMLYGAGTLGTHTATGILGEWQFAFANNTDVTVTAPDGSSTVFVIPAEDAAKFAPAGFMSTYFGVQPNQLANIGLSATISRIAITDGDATVLDDQFETIDEFQKVDPLNWTVLANPEALWVINSDRAYWLSWTLPAPGFEPFTSQSLGATDPWTFVEVPPVQIGARMFLLLQGIDLPAVAQAYFRLEMQEEDPEGL